MKLTPADITANRLNFNSHTTHNPDCDILELKINQDAFITYGINLKTGTEFLEYYAGENYVPGSSNKSTSRMYPCTQIPKKYLHVWHGLKAHYNKNFK
jgi:hypothetical protein